ncbi:LytTR family DNA-binding domain-containing protein [Sphingobacterium sp. lm-10]|uniref:LytR/AlgR family response regulator transcription factor n=1 Tax=Sphingobacterium sp. lm-10 TaxID=2944904 RepID=UPI0020220116|nr:LytTR family DNA-binding domain-containing protein [Sphingobacterium sp. lm-10]MCL7987070.1 LytTR family DNA-binding domain-containing protein [Sphingobacterium sp. lm-10]
MIKVVIIEDEPAVRKEISYLVQQETDMELIGWTDNVCDATTLLEQKMPDIVLMDIQLRDGTAFDVLNQLKTIPQNIIFITAYNHFAIKAIKYGALDYLLKPIDQTELQEALDRYRRRREDNPQWMQQLSLAQQSIAENQLPESIALNSVNNIRIIPVQDILYCKGDGPYTHFHLQSGKVELTSKPLKYFEELLPNPHFLRTHQSYLVNRKYISSIQRSEILVLENKEEIPISLRRKNFIIEQLSLAK